MSAKRVILQTGHIYPFVCLQIDIVGHSKLVDAERILHEAKERFHKQITGLAENYGGEALGWKGDGGAFLFLVTDGHEYDEAVFAAFRILESLPSINKELRLKTGLTQALSVRLSLDSGQAIYNKNHGLITGDFLNAFLKNERDISLKGAVTITERIHRQICVSLRERFIEFKHSENLGCQIYCSERPEPMKAARVLLVEDNELWQTILQEQINLALPDSDPPRIVGTFQDGARELRQGKWDLIITDIGLPGSGDIPGMDLVILAKEEEIPCIVVSGTEAVKKEHVRDLLGSDYQSRDFFSKEELQSSREKRSRFRSLIRKIVTEGANNR